MENTIIKANCLDQRLILSSTPLIASGGVNENIAEFDFCPLWDGFSKTAIFYRNETEKYYAIIDSENKCVIPWEVLQSDGKLFFGVYGVKGGVRRTSEILGYKIKLGAFDEKLKPSEPTPDIYSQYVNKIAAVENRMTPVEEFTIKPTSFELTGNPIQMQNYEGMPFSAIETQFSPKQGGSGDPSPTNIRPISGYDNLRLVRCGKNLIDPSKYVSSKTENGVTFAVSKDGSILMNGTATDTTMFDMFVGTTNNERTFLIPGKTYTISFGSAFAAIPGEARMVIGYRTSANDTWNYPVYVSKTKSRTFVLPDDAEFVITRIRLSAGDVCDNVLVTPQIELGSAATVFEPYRGDTYSVCFNTDVYGGKMNWNTGELAAEWKMLTLDGAEAWNLNAGRHPYFRLAIGEYGDVIDGEGRCSHCIQDAMSVSINGPYNRFNVANSIATSSAALLVRPDMTLYPDAAAWKTYLAEQYAAGTPVQIAYKLATPQIIQLIPQQIAALDGTNTLYSDGEIKVTGRKDIIWLTSDLIKRKADKLNTPVLIDTITVEEDVQSIYITKEPDGTPYSFKKMVILIKAKPGTKGNWTLYPFTVSKEPSEPDITIQSFPDTSSTYYGMFIADVYDGFISMTGYKGSHPTVLTSTFSAKQEIVSSPINQVEIRTSYSIYAGSEIEIWGIRT